MNSSNNQKVESVTNIFGNKKAGGFDVQNTVPFTGYHKLNDYDSNLLNNNSVNELSDEFINLEYKIAEKTEMLDAINTKIKGAELLGKLLDVMELKIQAKTLEKEIAELKEQYSKRNFAEKLAGSAIKQKKNEPVVIRMQKFISKKIIAKVSKKFKSIMDLSDSLDTLKSINQNVDELIAMKVPYGETTASYEKLTAYLYRANKIHSQISKSMGAIK